MSSFTYFKNILIKEQDTYIIQGYGEFNVIKGVICEAIKGRNTISSYMDITLKKDKEILLMSLSPDLTDRYTREVLNGTLTWDNILLMKFLDRKIIKILNKNPEDLNWNYIIKRYN